MEITRITETPAQTGNAQTGSIQANSIQTVSVQTSNTQAGGIKNGNTQTRSVQTSNDDVNNINTTPTITVYLCDDCVEGIFTAIYKAWEAGTSHTDVRIRNNGSISFFEDYIKVETDKLLSEKVASSILRKLSFEVYMNVYYACLSDDEDKASYIYHFLQKAFKFNGNIMNKLHDNDVNRIYRLRRAVGNEAGRYREFIRFEELENGVLAGRIEPKYNIIPLITDHFADRMHNEHWIILDTKRSISAVHVAYKGYAFTDQITEANLLNFSGLSKKEADFQALWKRFFDTIAIEERINPNLQRNLMPLRFRKYMKAENTPSLKSRDQT